MGYELPSTQTPDPQLLVPVDNLEPRTDQCFGPCSPREIVKQRFKKEPISLGLITSLALSFEL